MRACVALALLLGCSSSSATVDGGGGGGGDAGGDAALEPDARSATCGNGVQECGEECDDGNTTSGDGCDSSCRVEPYSGAPASAVTAMHAMNALRAQACEGGARLDSHVVASSQNHASYYANNPACYTGGMSPHVESATCGTGFTGVQFYDRMTYAGFTGTPMYETMAFQDDPQAAVTEWLNTVFHRIPMLHPSMSQLGYGGATGVDVCDFGQMGSGDAIIVWPPVNATAVPATFDTTREGPMPPGPPGGGTTTGPLVSVFFANGSNGSITSHSISVGATAVPDTAITPSDPTFGAYMDGSYCFYPDPKPAGTTFTVSITGTVNGQSFTKSWSFTTQ